MFECQRSPSRWIMLILGVIMFFGAFVRWEPAPFDVFMAVMMLITFCMYRTKWAHIDRSVLLMVGLFVICNVMALLFAQNLNRALFYLGVDLYLIALLIFYIGFLQRFKLNGLVSLLNGYVAGAAATTTWAILELWNILPTNFMVNPGHRVLGMFKEPNVFAPYLLPCLLYLTATFWQKVGRVKFLLALLLLILTFGLTCSLSRAALAGFLFSLGLFLVLPWYANRDQRLILAFLLITFTFVSVLGCYSNSVTGLTAKKRLGLADSHNVLQPYDHTRFKVQLEAFRTAIRRPLGIGPGQSEQFFNYATHNVFLRVAVEGGWLAFLGFLGLLVLCLRRSITLLESGREQSWVYAMSITVIVAFLLISLVIDSLHWRHFWFILAIPWADYDHEV